MGDEDSKFMVLQAFIDDSYDPPKAEGLFVLGGHIATPEHWIAFSREWKELLPLYPSTLGPNGIRRFKMSEVIQSVAEGGFEAAVEKVQPFFRVIEKHVICSVACAVDLQGFENAKCRVRLIDKATRENVPLDWAAWGNRYFFTFRCLMDMFHGNRDRIDRAVSADEKIDFFFDDQREKKIIGDTWDGYISTRPDEFQPYYGGRPRFENDEEFTQLQAADLWAWSARRWLESGQRKKMMGADYGPWRATADTHTQLVISFDEDQIIQALVKKSLAFLRDRTIEGVSVVVAPELRGHKSRGHDT